MEFTHPSLHFYALVAPNRNIAIFFRYSAFWCYLSFSSSTWLNPFDETCLFLFFCPDFAWYPENKLFYRFTIEIFFKNPAPKFWIGWIFDSLALSSKFSWFVNFKLRSFFKLFPGFYMSGKSKFLSFIELISWRLLNNFSKDFNCNSNPKLGQTTGLLDFVNRSESIKLICLYLIR